MPNLEIKNIAASFKKKKKIFSRKKTLKSRFRKA